MLARSSRCSAVASRTGGVGGQLGGGVEIHGIGRPTLSAQEEGYLLLGYAVEPGDERLPLIAIAPQAPHHPEEHLAGDVFGRRGEPTRSRHVAVDGVEMRAIERLDGRLLAPAGSFDQPLLAAAVTLRHLDVGQQVGQGRRATGRSGAVAGSTDGQPCQRRPSQERRRRSARGRREDPE